jgi:hypothetical protein
MQAKVGGGAACDSLSGAMKLLADLQQAVAAAQAQKDGTIGPTGIVIPRDTFELVTGAVLHEYPDLRKLIGGRMELFNVEAAALSSADGKSWFLKLRDSIGQNVDFKISKADPAQVTLVIHDYDGISQHNETNIKNSAAIAQLAKLLQRAKPIKEFQEQVKIGGRYMSEVQRALATATSPRRVRVKSELAAAMLGAANGRVSEMERAITMFIGSKFTFLKFKNRYDDSANDHVEVQLSDDNSNDVTIRCESVFNDDGDTTIDYTAKISWSLANPDEGRSRGAPQNKSELQKWFREFEFLDPGGSTNGGTNGEMDLEKRNEKRFATAVLKYAKKRKWITPDTSKGSLGRFLKL